MNNIVFLIMRRMRLPLLTLVTVYAITVLGMTLIPGQDADGNIWYMDIFHACLLYTSPSPRDDNRSRMPSSA